MKASRYNTLFQAEDGTRLAFNAMSAGFATLTPAQYEEARKMLDDPDGYICETEETEQLKRDLIRGRFLVDDDVDEFKILKARDLSDKFNTDRLSLTICPTLQCNLNCLYCYQSQFIFQEMVQQALNVKMSDEVKTGLKRLIADRAGKLHSFHAEWYGGEPLLGLDTVLELSSEFKKTCERNNCLYTSGMVTNGYTLDESTIARLKEAGVDAILFTLDGPPPVHDGRRPLKSGGGTFDVVLNNVKLATEQFTGVDVRVNVDKTNYEAVPALLDILEGHGLKDKIRIFFTALEFDKKSTEGLTRLCWAIPEFSKREITLSEQAMSRGFKVLNLLKVNPLSSSKLCSAVKQNHFVVDPNGSLHKCLGEVGDIEFRIGYIDENGQIKQNYKAVEWLNWTPLENEDCATCKVLPVCRGGCMMNEVVTLIKGDRYIFEKSGRCATIRSNLPKMLDLYHRAIMNQRGAES